MSLDPADPPNRTRDHLANERTFLAWARTALGLIGLGFVLARMGLFLRQLAALGGHPAVPAHHEGHEFLVLGGVFLLVGTVLCGWSGWLYERARRGIDSGRYQPAHHAVFLLTALLALGGIVMTGLVVARTINTSF